MPATKLRPVGRMLLGAGKLPLAADTTPRTPHTVAVDTTPSVAYGRYLATIAGCQLCHGASFSGAAAFRPNEPPASNITPGGIGHYTEADFVRALREGTGPSGGKLSEAMPWKYFGKMSDGELHAIWLYLQSVPSKNVRES